jgi:TonB family protein
MIWRICFLISFVAAVSVTMAAQTEPSLLLANIPKYPPVARQARIEGVVRLTFLLPANGLQPTNVEVVSGHPMLKGAAVENVKTWRFEQNPYAVERKYETTFKYRLSGVESAGRRIKATFDSFREVEVVTDVVPDTVSY